MTQMRRWEVVFTRVVEQEAILQVEAATLEDALVAATMRIDGNELTEPAKDWRDATVQSEPFAGTITEIV